MKSKMQRKFGSSFVVIFSALALVLLQGSLLSEAKSKNIIDIYNPAVFNIAVLRNQKPVVVFFASEKCSLCQKILGRLEAKAEDEYSEDLYLARADIDKFPELMESLGVSQTPTLRVYINGIMTDEIRGLKMPLIMETLDRVGLTARLGQKFKNRRQG